MQSVHLNERMRVRDQDGGAAVAGTALGGPSVPLLGALRPKGVIADRGGGSWGVHEFVGCEREGRVCTALA